MLGPCPVAKDLCGIGASDRGTLLCDRDCGGHGTCVQGSCKCHVGWVGTTCEDRICWDDSHCLLEDQVQPLHAREGPCQGIGRIGREYGADTGSLTAVSTVVHSVVMQECHESGECVMIGNRSIALPPAAGTPPPPPPTGYYQYSGWGQCIQQCDGELGSQHRDAVCKGDCADMDAAVVIRPCAAAPCANACDDDPCGEDNLCSVQLVARSQEQYEVSCLCTDGKSGVYCHMSASGCHLDAADTCCPATRALAVTGECCAAHMTVDVYGYCCEPVLLDGCGVCNGGGVLVDALGNCCPTAVTDANGACCLSQLDSCGARSRVQTCARGLRSMLVWHASAARADSWSAPAGVCAGSSRSCLASFLIVCEALPLKSNTLEALPSSVTLITDIQAAITTALGIPDAAVRDISVSLHSSLAWRSMLQVGNLDIAIELYQQDISQSLATQEIASLVRSGTFWMTRLGRSPALLGRPPAATALAECAADADRHTAGDVRGHERHSNHQQHCLLQLVVRERRM
jgi:hypothetical protein